jgi:hypothetical protein
VVLVREQTIPTERPPLVGELRANFADRGCRVGSATDPHGRILGFLDRQQRKAKEKVLKYSEDLRIERTLKISTFVIRNGLSIVEQTGLELRF